MPLIKKSYLRACRWETVKPKIKRKCSLCKGKITPKERNIFKAGIVCDRCITKYKIKWKKE